MFVTSFCRKWDGRKFGSGCKRIIVSCSIIFVTNNCVINLLILFGT